MYLNFSLLWAGVGSGEGVGGFSLGAGYYSGFRIGGFELVRAENWG